ncbi:NAD(P)H-binding protein [Actinomyces sp. HMT897]|uniref:NAD(P)-dependent oxidoreductase n=1 Tax=Actinomyces sp. HMT897 TaxID=2789424 RepID=UPI00190D0589|nr:NAD(P)H-binding protein [Actinomyces sp. HMT897]QQO77130.1 NAD(P)H-binding protein [Actinomyces sp. HMT897]
MKILILGATGPTGRHVLANALKAGDTVSVLARHPEALADVEDRVTVFQGDATLADDVARAAEGQDVVIVTLGRGRSLKPEGLFTGAATAVVEAMQRTDVKRLVWLSAYGVGETIRTASLLQRLAYRTLVRRIYADKAASERILRASGLEWTIVYPTVLTNNPARGTYRVAESMKMRGMPRISRADVGAFIHKAAHDSAWIRRDAVITD